MRIPILEDLAKKGTTFSVRDVANIANVKEEVAWVVLSRLEKRGWLERIEKGKYIIVPLNSEKGKYTLHEFVIGSLLVHPCCVAYWSALNFYGLSEQIPSTVFIQTTSRRKIQKKKIFGIDYQIVCLKNEKFFAMKKEWIDETKIEITDQEKTIIDCLDKPHYSGGVVEVAKALKNGKFDGKRLLDYARRIGNSGVARRLGYLCDILDIDVQIPKPEVRNYLYLDPTMPHKGKRIAKWRLIDNLGKNMLGELE